MKILNRIFDLFDDYIEHFTLIFFIAISFFLCVVLVYIW